MFQTKLFKRLLLFCTGGIALLLIFTGCIPIKSLGEYWDKGGTDPSLAGYWKETDVDFGYDDKYCSFIEDQENKVYQWVHKSANTPDVAHAEFALTARTIKFGDYTFLMLDDVFSPMRDAAETEEEKKAIEVIAGLQRYDVQGDVLTIYHLKDHLVGEAIRDEQVKGILPPQTENQEEDSLDSPMWTQLDESTIAFLLELCADPTNWTRKEQYTRVDDFEAALIDSRTYPATPDTPANTMVTINQPDLAWFMERRSHLLMQHLQASPQWKVFREHEAIIAYERHLSNGEWIVSLNGYQSNFVGNNQNVQTRRMFRFSEAGGGAFANPYNRDQLTIVDPLAGQTQLNLIASSQGIQSYLAVGAPGLWFEFFEQTNREPREQTRAALDELAVFLAGLRQVIEARGHARELLPEDALILGESSLDVRDSFQGGLFDVYARANPGRQGYVYLKCFRVSDNESLSEKRLFHASQEYIGWSANPEELFSYNSHIMIEEGDWDSLYEARFELWFCPDDGSPHVLLVKTQRQINGWER